jgi:uncharacterized membrane protein YtjA (UPF0391 family)
MAAIFFILSLVGAIFGFLATDAAADVGKMLFVVFLGLSIVSIISGRKFPS